MDLLCEVCDRLVIGNQSEYNIYLATSRERKTSLY